MTTVSFAAGLALLAPLTVAEPAPPSSSASGEHQEASTAHDTGLTDLLASLRKGGFLDDREATLEEVEMIVERAQDMYIRGDSLGSAILLFEVGHNPRFQNFVDLPIGSTIDYHLGVALQSYGASGTAREAFSRVMSRGVSDDFFGPALRRHVDIGLDGKNYALALDELSRALGPAGGTTQLGHADLDEYEYLQARARQQAGDFSGAVDAYRRVGPTSRFYTASLYLQGVVLARGKQWRAAEDAFCKVVGGPNQSTAVYYVDQRYFEVRDLAHLGLGRVAHEELRHEHSFYHYFQVPQDSEHLPAALFEASWTMAEAGEHAVARDLIHELRDRFPAAPQSVEARLLAALLQLYECDFRRAEDEFTRFIDDLVPVIGRIEQTRTDPIKLRALHRELTALRAGEQDMSGDLEAHRLLLVLLDEDPRYARLSRDANALRAEARFATALYETLLRLRNQLQGRDTASRRDQGGDALAVFEQTERLERALAGLDRQIREAEAAGASTAEIRDLEASAKALESRVRQLETRARNAVLSGPIPGSAQTNDLIVLLDRDAARMVQLRARSLTLADRLDQAAAQAASDQLGVLHKRLDAMLGEARMGRIDAVLGAKKKLEIEVRDMAAGRFPPELFGKLQIEGMVTDAEEFWPYEGEYWADEYEGYR